jgi:hypothetical protein
MLVEEVGTTKLPSDLGGLTVLAFTKTDPPAAGLGPAATRIRDVAAGWRDRPFDVEIADRLERTLRLSLSQIQDLGGLRAEVGLHVFLVDVRTDPPQLVRVARARTSPKSPRPWPPFARGVGVVGTCWLRSESIFVDLTSPEMQANASEWTSRTEDERFGMTFEMLKQSRQRYKCVGAVPITTIRGDEGFLGCVSYNLGVAATSVPETFREPVVEGLLDACVELVAIVSGH